MRPTPLRILCSLALLSACDQSSSAPAVVPGADGGGDAADVGEPPSEGPTADGGGALPGSSWEASLDAQHVEAALTADGLLDEAAWAEASAVTFDDRSEASDNLLSVRALWTATHLHLGFEMRDADVSPDTEPPIWERDGVELFFDTRSDGGSELGGDDFHLTATVGGAVELSRGGGAGAAAEDVGWAVREGVDGYVAELAVPWSTLSTDVGSTRGMGLLVAGNDRDGEAVAQFAWTDVHPFANPSGWGSLQLLGGPAPVEPPACDGHTIEAEPGSDISNVLEAAVATHGDVCIPEGDFRILGISIARDDWSIRGAGIDRTTIVVPAGFGTYMAQLRGRRWSFGGFTIDVERESDRWQTNGAPRFLFRGGDWEYSDVRVKGTVGPHFRASHIYINGIEAGTTGVMRNLYLLDGSAPPNEASDVGGMASFHDWPLDGHLILDNVQMRGWANNTAYLDGRNQITVRNSFFHNTNVGMRISGGTLVENTVFVLDGPIPIQAWSEGQTMRGVWLASNAPSTGTVRIVDSDFTMPAAILGRYHLDRIEVENVRIRGNVRVDVGSGYVRASCVDGDIEGVAAESVTRSGCAPRTTPPVP